MKRSLILALAVMMVLASALPAFANVPSTGTESTPAQGAITKTLKMPVGTTTPAITFSFNFAPTSVDGDPYDSTIPNVPAVPTRTITFSAADIGTSVEGTKTVDKESANFMAGITFPHAGVYKYRVTEANSVTGLVTGESVTVYSKAEYDVTVIVENGTSGTYIAYIVAERMVSDDGTGVPGGEKVDPRPGGDKTTYFVSQMIFTNEFVKTTGGDPDDPENEETLSISKVVAGLGANQGLFFDFNVTVTKPAVGVPGAQSYKAYVVDNTGVVSAIGTDITAVTNVASDGANDYIVFPSATPVAVSLKHNQRLVFTDLHVGSSFIVSEAAVADYIAKYSLVLNSGTPSVVDNGVVNQALVIASNYISEGIDSADFTNTRDLVAPTGISVDSLPYYFVIASIVVGLAAFVVLKSRRSGEYIA
jgi:hypothetical protein